MYVHKSCNMPVHTVVAGCYGPQFALGQYCLAGPRSVRPFHANRYRNGNSLDESNLLPVIFHRNILDNHNNNNYINNQVLFHIPFLLASSSSSSLGEGFSSSMALCISVMIDHWGTCATPSGESCFASWNTSCCWKCNRLDFVIEIQWRFQFEQSNVISVYTTVNN